jgi:hypothetical protein
MLMLLSACAFLLPARAQATDASPAYQIVLRSRHAQVLPDKDNKAQTGGGSIVVEQPELNTIVITMGGSAVAGSGCHGCSNAGLTFELAQDLDIVPLRANVRPPRVGMIGRVVGTLQVTEPGKYGHASGSAQQGPASACLSTAGMSVLALDVEPSAVACGQKLAVNHQYGPVEAPVASSTSESGCYRLSATFGVSANQQKGVFNRRYAVADFDPAPQLDPFWADALKPFRAVPRNEFGYKLVLRVVEDSAAEPTAANHPPALPTPIASATR